MTYGDFKDLTRRTVSSKILRDKAFNIDKNLKYDRYQGSIVSMVYTFFNKKNSGGAATLVWNQALATRNKSSVKSENITQTNY